MPKPQDIIEFEDLHGNPDPDAREVDVDLDAGKDPAVRRARLDRDDDGGKPPDDDLFDDLPSRRERDERPADREDRPERRGRGNDFDARLDRERTARQRERDRADAAERRAADLEAELETTRKQRSETSRKELDDRIKVIEGQLEAALESEDSKAQVRLTSELTDVKARRIALDYVDQPTRQTDDEKPTRQPRNEHLDKFLDTVGDWYKRDGFARETRLLNRLDREVHQDGFDPRSKEYFVELKARMKEKAPELFEDDDTDRDDDDLDARGRDRDDDRRGRDRDRGRSRDEDDDRGRRRPRRTPVAGADRDADGRSARRQTDQNRVRLTEADFANMRSFGLNVDDPEVLKEYARNKRQTEREYADERR